MTKRAGRTVGKMPGSALAELVICFVAVTSILGCVMRATLTTANVSAVLCRERTEIERYASMLREINAGVISSDADSGRWSVRVVDGSPGPRRVTVFGRANASDMPDVSRVQVELSLWMINSRR